MAFNWGALFDLGTKVVAPLATAYVGSKASKKAAKAQQAGSAQAMAYLSNQYNQSRSDLAPWRKAGSGALNWLTKLSTPGAVNPNKVNNYLTKLPGYDFAQREGEKAWERKYSGRAGGFGGLNSGRAGKELMRWNADRLAGPSYQNWLNQLQTLAGYGQSGNALTANLGANNANMMGQYALNSANAGAEGDIGSSALWTKTANDIAYNPAYSQYLRSLTA